MLKGKTVPLDVIGDIVACKTVGLANVLVRKGAKVYALMTENATHFTDPIAFESLISNKRLVDTFDRNSESSVEHVALAKRASVVMIAPASTNVIGKIVHGIAGDTLITTTMACRCKKILASAMNTDMYESPILQGSLDIYRRYGIEVTTPAWGYLACGDTGAGRMPESEVLYEYILRRAGYPGDSAGRWILVTAGSTREPIDPVRYITNHFTGKMGYATARAAVCRGTDITLVSGPVGLDRPLFMETIPVEGAREIFEAITARSGEQDIITKAAAMVGYRLSTVGIEKIEKFDGDLSITLERTDDILGWLRQNWRDGQLLCGFFMETQNILENSRAKLVEKQIDMIMTNNLKVEGAGLGTGTNVVTLITRGSETEPPIMSKGEVADRPLIETLKRAKGQGGLNPA